MKTEKEKMLAEGLYNAGHLSLVEERRRARQLTRLFNQTTEEQKTYRVELLKQLFKQTGEKLYIEPTFKCDYGKNITIGENFYANFDCIILDVAEVEIGNNVLFAPKVGLYTASHPIDATVRNSGLELGKRIKIGNNVWMGANASVNPGVTIGDNTIIGSGSVVTKNIPANVIATGNPCKVIRSITEEDQRQWQEAEDAYWRELEV